MAANERDTAAIRVLVTGSRGLVGRWTSRHLKSLGYAVSGFDIRDGQDVLDVPALTAAVHASDVVVHAAVAAFGSDMPDEQMRRVNVAGTANVLSAAESAGHDRVIFFSSCQVFGVFDGHRAPASFPLRDSHERVPVGPYGSSKIEAEDECANFTQRTGIATICFRPAHIWVPGQAADKKRLWARNPKKEFELGWSCGAFVDVRDVCTAVSQALRVPVQGHHGLLLCAEDIAATIESAAAAARVFPETPFEAEWAASAGPYAALFDTTPARELLGWRPHHTWRDGSNESWGARLRRRLRQPRPV